MLSMQQIRGIVNDSLNAINEEKAEGSKIPISDDTVLLGTGTLLDSLDFVLLVTNVEEGLQNLTGQEVAIGADLQSFEEENPFRTVATLSNHIETILQLGQSNE